MRSIRRQLTAELLVTVVLLQTLGLAAFYVVARKGTVAGFDDALRAKALAVSSLIVATPTGLRADSADFFLGVGGTVETPTAAETDLASSERFSREFQRRDRHNYFEVWDAAGRRLARSRSLGEKDLPRLEGITDRPVIWDFPDAHDEANRAVGFLFRPQVAGSPETPPRLSAPVLLIVAAEREALDHKLQRLQLLVAVCTLLLVGTTFWVMPKLLRRGLKPLDVLAENVARIDAGSLAARLAVTAAPAELHVVIERLNALLARLEESFERERRFSADVAHELRTPIAELRGLAECAIKWPDSREPAYDADVLAIARQMETMVKHMLSLARGERGDLRGELESVGLSPVVKAVLHGFGPRIAERSLAVEFRSNEVGGLADPVLLRSVLTVLIENAIDYAPTGGSIAVAVGESGGAAEIRISNQAGELEAADLPHMFDRFWRKEQARSGGLHLGLGLPLARTYASAMGWSIHPDLDDHGRLTLTLAGPLAPRTEPVAASAGS